MFKFLREKITNWAKSIGKKKSEEPEKTKESGKERPSTEKKITVKPEKSFLTRVKEKISSVTISEKDFDVYGEDLRMLLLENNVAYEVAERIINNLRVRIVGKEMLKKEIEAEVMDVLRGIVEEILIEPFSLEEKITEKKINGNGAPYIILFVGINGTGKTTTIAKIGHRLKKKGISSVIAAGDTFRAASIEQLKKHGEALGIKVISQEYGADPASVGFDAISYAKKNHINCVLIDTAGRMHTAKNLMKEIEKISKVCKPDLKIFVGESVTGNDSVEQVKAFDSSIGIDAIILTKADVDEKGGTALSVGYALKRPILFLGVGQEMDDLKPFDKRKFSEKLGL